MIRAKLYIIEDDETIVTLLTNHFSKSYQVRGVRQFRDVLAEIREFQPDLILMDIGLPYFNGFHWTTRIREELTVPILFVSSSDDEASAVMAMSMGADDFISKPFSLPILEAKISAFLRRSKQFAKTSLTCGDYELTLDGLFSHEANSIQLSPTETKILSLLIEHQPQVVSKDKLLDRLWEGGDFIDTNTLSVNMTRLRKKVAELGFDRIETVRGVGYRIDG